MITVIWLIIHFQLIDKSISDRVLGVFINREGFESDGRVELFELAYKSFFDKPIIGNGTGSLLLPLVWIHIHMSYPLS